MNVKLILSLYRGLYPLNIPGHVALADLHHNVTCPCPPLNPDSQTLGQLLIYTQAALHALQRVMDRDVNAASSSPCLFFIKQSDTPVTRTIP